MQLIIKQYISNIHLNLFDERRKSIYGFFNYKKRKPRVFSLQRILLFYVNQPISYFLGLIFTKTWIGSDTHFKGSLSFSDLILCLRVIRKKYVESFNTYFE